MEKWKKDGKTKTRSTDPEQTTITTPPPQCKQPATFFLSLFLKMDRDRRQDSVGQRRERNAEKAVSFVNVCLNKYAPTQQYHPFYFDILCNVDGWVGEVNVKRKKCYNWIR